MAQVQRFGRSFRLVWTLQLAANRLAQVVYIGYSFSDGVDEYIYWFPSEMVVDPFTGAVDYVPLA